MIAGRVHGLAAAVVLAAGAPVHAAAALATSGVADPNVSWWRVALVLVFCVFLAACAAFGAAIAGRHGGVLGGVRVLLESVRAGRGADDPTADDPVDGERKPVPRLAAVLKLLPPGTRRLRLVESLRLSHQVDVCLIRCDDDELAVTTSPQGATLLFMRPAPALPADVAPGPDRRPTRVSRSASEA